MRNKEVRQFVEYVRNCPGWTVIGTGPYRFCAPTGETIHMHGTVNQRTLANRQALLHRYGLPRRRGRA